MKQYFLFLNLLVPITTNCWFEHEQTITTKDSITKKLQESKTLNRLNEKEKMRAVTILNLANTTLTLKNNLPKDPTAKKIARISLGGAALATAGKYLLDSQTRGISDISTLAGIGIGAAGTAGLVYWWIGRELETIVSFRPTLTKLTNELKKMETLVAELSASHEDLLAKVDNTVTLTAEIKEALPAVVEASGDNARLADVLQITIDELKEQRVLVAYLMNQLPPEQRAQALTQAGITIQSEDQRKAEALNAYNKGRLLKRTHQFKKIPDNWLLNNGYADLIQSKTI